MKKAKEFRDQSFEELKLSYQSMNRRLFELRNQQKIEKETKQSHLFKETRKEIARLLTVLQEKQAAS